MSYEEDMLSPCSDSGCILRDPTDKTPRQYTNGGCQHLKERGPQLTKLLVLMGAEITRLRQIEAVYEERQQLARALAKGIKL